MNKKITSFLILLALTSTTSTTFAQTMPGLIPVSGTLTDADGALLAGTHDVTVSVHADEDGNAPALFEQTTSVEGASLHILLDPDAKLAAAFASGEARYLELEIDGEVMTPRLRLGAVPYALRAAAADNAVTLGGRPASEFVNVTSLGSSLLAALSATSPLAINQEGGKLTIQLTPCAEPGAVWQSAAGMWTCAMLNRYVGSDSIEVSPVQGSMSDFAIRIKERGVEGRHLKAGELTNEHLSDNADISPGKINGRAAVLFGNDVQNFKNNTLVIDQNRIAINKPSADSGVSLDIAGLARATTFRGTFERSAPATKTIKLPAAAFQVARGNGFAGDWQLHIDGYGQIPSTSAVRAVSLIATLPEVPDDANITAMRCAYRVTAGQLQGSYAELVRAPWGSLTRTRNTLALNSPAAGQQFTTAAKTVTGFGALSSNATHHVLLVWNHTGTTQNNSGLFFGCEVDYSTTRL